MIRALLVVAMLGGIAAAQPAPGPGPAKRAPADPMVDRRAEVKKKIRVLRAATLTDELKLDEKTLARLLPTLAKWDDVTEDLLKKRIDINRRLADIDTAKDPRGTDKLIDEAVANQKQFWNLEEQRLVELRKILTPGQIARLLVVLPQFERRIQNQLRRAINGGGMGRANPARANRRGRQPQPDDEDDDLDLEEPVRGRR